MDLVTQALAGAALAQAAARRPDVRLAAAVGAAAGLLPDADVLLGSADDPLRQLELHRHFTHALAFAPVGALAVAALAWPFARGRARFASLYGFALLGISTAGVLDALTSFGTSLLLPFSDVRVAWSLLAVVDPAFSLPLAAGVALAVGARSAGPARAGLALALAYVGLALAQHERAERAAVELARSRGHAPVRIEVKPTMGNVVLWRSVYLADGRIHADAVRAGMGGTRVYPGESAPRVPGGVPEAAPDTVLGRDVARFARVADGWLVRHPDRPDVVGDARYAMLPTSIRPLWGVVVDPARADAHAAFVTLRSLDGPTRRAFTTMLLGRDPADPAPTGTAPAPPRSTPP